MHIKKSSKRSSFLLSALLLLNVVAPLASPMSTYAESDEPTVVEVQAKESSHISVSDAIGFNNDQSKKTVAGCIVGYANSGTSVSRETFPEDWNVAIADNPKETNLDNMVFVQVPKNFRAEFGLKSNPDNMEKEVIITGSLEKYHGHFGLKDPTAMEFGNGITDPEPDIPLKTISIRDARSQGTGSVQTKGIVTAFLKNSIQIQDDGAAIAVRPTSLDVEVGDEITVAGDLSEYNGMLQLNGATIEEEHGKQDVPASLTINTSELAEHQSELVLIENLKIKTVEDGGDWANYIVEDEHGNEFIIRDELNEFSQWLGEGNSYNSIAGVASEFNGELQIIPRGLQDIVFDDSIVQAVYATPKTGNIPSGTEVKLATNTKDASIHYTLDGSTPDENSEKYAESITINKDLTLKAIAISTDNVKSEVTEYAYTVYDAEEGIRIHDIQGEGHESPMIGDSVREVEGIVTYRYDIRGSHYFHMQTPEEHYDGNPKTSEGIVIYTGREENIDVGDLIQVTGNVSEYHIDGYDGKEDTDLSVTQINARDDQGGIVDIIENDVELPTAIKITSSNIPGEINGDEGFDIFEPENYSVDYWESIEGMRVEVAESTSVAPQLHGDLVVITNDYEPENRTVNGGILLTEDGPDSRTIQFKVQPNGPAKDLRVKTGDKFNNKITGVVNYGFGNYKIYADLEDIEAAHEEIEDYRQEETTLKFDEEKLTVGAYNVENYSANTSETSNIKAGKIAEAFVESMDSPDIIALIEVMSNDGSDSISPEAAKSYQRMVDDIVKVGGPAYEFVNIDPEQMADGGKPTGNIRVGYLYNPERVDFIEKGNGGAKDAVSYEDGELTLNPGRLSPEVFENTRKPLVAQFEFKGETIVLVNNHLNSKLGDEPYYGKNQPPVFGSREQRKKLAAELNRFVKEIKEDNSEENVIVLGDMNDFEFSEPLQVLKGEELTNMVETVPAAERYSYVYQGSSQVLDHLLVSNNIADATEIDMINVNADFTDMHGRASDHNPILGQIDLHVEEDSDITEDQAAADEVSNLLATLPTFGNVVLEDREDIEAGRAAYDALTPAQQKLVIGYTFSRLTNAEKELKESTRQVKEVKRSIYNLPRASELTLADKDKVEEVRDMVNHLADEDKEFVTSISQLEAREAKLKELDRHRQVKKIKRSIYNLPRASELTLADKGKVEEVRDMYNKLSDEDKKFVITISQLKAREAKLKRLEK